MSYQRKCKKLCPSCRLRWTFFSIITRFHGLEDVYKRQVVALHKAIAAAQAILDNEDATQAEVDEALNTLKEAMKNLSIKEEVSIDKHALLEKLNEALAKRCV